MPALGRADERLDFFAVFGRARLQVELGWEARQTFEFLGCGLWQ